MRNLCQLIIAIPTHETPQEYLNSDVWWNLEYVIYQNNHIKVMIFLDSTLLQRIKTINTQQYYIFSVLCLLFSYVISLPPLQQLALMSL